MVVKKNTPKKLDKKNYEKYKKYILRGQRNTRYHKKILSNKKKLIV